MDWRVSVSSQQTAACSVPLNQCSIEKALERDYYMTGIVSCIFADLDLLTVSLAQEAMEFGIVDGVLERRPTSDSS